MIVYQLVASGLNDVTGQPYSIRSAKVYTNPPSDEEVHEFIKSCTHKPGAFFNLEGHTITTRISELTLVDNGKVTKPRAATQIG